MTANTPRFDLDTDVTLGGDNASDYAAVSQKAIKYYVDHSAGGIVVDNALSTTSENPVQNKIITSAMESFQNYVDTQFSEQSDTLKTKQDKLASNNAGANIVITPELDWSTATQNSNLGSHYWMALAYGGTKFVALDNAGYISTSTDGTTWSAATQNSNLGDHGWRALTYDGTKFVALGYSGYISTSTDGTTWTQSTQNSNLGNIGWRALTYDGTKFVALSEIGYISTSTDGITWTEATQNSDLGSHYWMALAYGGTKFVALSDNGYISTSTNGTTWSTATQNSNLGSRNWRALAYDGTKFVALGYAGHTSASTDGTTWFTATQNLSSRNWSSLAYDETKFVALGYYGYIATKQILKISATVPTVDQTFDGTSTHAQSGVAIYNALTDGSFDLALNNTISFVNGDTSQASYPNIYYDGTSSYFTFSNAISTNEVYADGFYIGSGGLYVTGQDYDEVTLDNSNSTDYITLNSTGVEVNTSSSGNTFTYNGNEVATVNDIPTKISDLTDDTATYPVDKADTLTNLTATITELNYVDGVTSAIQTQFNTITGKIPSAATSSNQLADKAFVNSTIQTNTANFRGNWDDWTDVPSSSSDYPEDYTGSKIPTVNDYMVVQDASDYTGDTLEGTWRFKYTGVWGTDGKSGWLPEYQVNETPLTQAQLDAINSGITSTDVTLIGTALQPSDITNMVTTDTDQNITGTKTFVGSKKIAFKQSGSSDKLGFTLYNNSGTEKGYLEYNPTNTVDSVPLMTLGNYATASGGLTHVGFRKYSNVSGANGAYNLLAPLISDAKTPFSLTTTYTNFYLPLGFTNGTTTVTTAKTGLCDLSNILPDISTKQDTLVSGTNIKTINNTSLLGSGNIDTKEVLVAEVGTTTYDAVHIAVNSGKVVYCHKYEQDVGDIYLPLIRKNLYSGYDFAGIIGNKCYLYNVVLGGWSSATQNLATSDLSNVSSISSSSAVYTALSNKQDTLVSGTNIKTINSTSLLGSGNVAVQETLTSGTNIKTINNNSLLGSGNIDTKEMFIAEYGITTANQITQALASGKMIFGGKTVSSIDYFYYYSGIVDSAYTFSRVYQNTSEVIYISTTTNQWNTITKTLANDNLSNVSSIDSSSAVATALNGKVNTSDIWYDSASSTLYIGVAQS